MDAKYIKSIPERLGIKPHDSTSNQLWVDTELYNDANTDLVVQTATELKDKGWLHIYTRVVSNHPLQQSHAGCMYLSRA